MRARHYALLLVLLGSTIHAQTPAPSAIQGVLVKWGTAEPVDQATVELRDAAGAPLRVTATRSNGEFEFSNLAGGNYRILAMAAGYATAEYAQLRQNGTGRPIRVAAGDRVTVRIGIVPGGIISGRITDQNGQPMVYANVQVFRLAYNAEGQLAPTVAQTTLTNDLGEYRAFWLPPGQYLVSSGSSNLNTFGSGGVTDPLGSDTTIPSTFTGSFGNAANASSGRQLASPPPVAETSPAARARNISALYYANAPDAQSADVIDLRAGGEVKGVNIRVAPIAGSQPVEIRGVVVDPAGAPVQGNYSLSISTWPMPLPTPLASLRSITTRVPPPNPSQFAPGAQVWVNDNGKFDGGAPSGLYQIRATQGALSGRVVLNVGNQDLDVRVQLRAAVSVPGRVVIEGAAGPASQAALDGLLVGVGRPPASQYFGGVGPDGSFQIDNVIVGDYQIYVPPLIPAPAAATNPLNPTLGLVTSRGETVPEVLQNAYVKSIRSGGEDLTNALLRVEGIDPVAPLQIVIGLKAASVAGRALAAGRPANQATVVLLPEGPPPYRSDRYKTLTTDESGRFQFKGIPPGNYRLLAWEDVDPGAWFNAQFLAAYERNAMPLQLVEGQYLDLELSAIPVAP